MSVAQEWLQSPEISRLGHSRRGGVEDAVDGITPALVIEPSSGEELAAAVAWVSRERLATIQLGQALGDSLVKQIYLMGTRLVEFKEQP